MSSARNASFLVLLAACAAPPAAESPVLSRARAFLESKSDEPNHANAALTAMALGHGPARDAILARLAKLPPAAASYPHDFSAAYIGLAILDAHARDKNAFLKEAVAWKQFLVSRQNKEGDWGYGFEMDPNRWIETTMVAPVLEALLIARDSGLAVDPGVFDRARRFLESYRAADGRFLNDKSRPPSTEATAAVVATLARLDPSSRSTAVRKADDLLAAMKGGDYDGLDKDDRETHGPGSYPYGLYYCALAERRLLGPSRDAARRDAFLAKLAAWQAPDGSFPAKRGSVYATALVILAVRALYE